MKLITTLLMAIPALASIVGLLWLNKRRRRISTSSEPGDVEEKVDSPQKLSKTNESSGVSEKIDDIEPCSSHQDNLSYACEQLQPEKNETCSKKAFLNIYSESINSPQLEKPLQDSLAEFKKDENISQKECISDTGFEQFKEADNIATVNQKLLQTECCSLKHQGEDLSSELTGENEHPQTVCRVEDLQSDKATTEVPQQPPHSVTSADEDEGNEHNDGGDAMEGSEGLEVIPSIENVNEGGAGEIESCVEDSFYSVEQGFVESGLTNAVNVEANGDNIPLEGVAIEDHRQSDEEVKVTAKEEDVEEGVVEDMMNSDNVAEEKCCAEEDDAEDALNAEGLMEKVDETVCEVGKDEIQESETLKRKDDAIQEIDDEKLENVVDNNGNHSKDIIETIECEGVVKQAGAVPGETSQEGEVDEGVSLAEDVGDEVKKECGRDEAVRDGCGVVECEEGGQGRTAAEVRLDWCDMVDEEMESKKRKKRNAKRRSYGGHADEKFETPTKVTSEKSAKKAGNHCSVEKSSKQNLKTPERHAKSPFEASSSKVKNASNPSTPKSTRADKSSLKHMNGNGSNSNALSVSKENKEPAMNVDVGEKSGSDGEVFVRKGGEGEGEKASVDEDKEDHDNHERHNRDSGLESGTSHSSPQQLTIVPDAQGAYYFAFPEKLCGLLIGRHGKNINQLCEESGASITVDLKDNQGFKPSHQIVTIAGAWPTIWKALDLLKKRFHPTKFPEIDFNPIPQLSPPPSPFFEPSIYGVNLPSTGEFVRVTVSMVNAPDHLFLHLPFHPCYVNPLVLNNNINYFYSRATSRPQTTQSLLLPQPIACNTLCIAYVNNAFFRGRVVEVGETSCLLKFIDFGGFNNVQNHCIYKISDDFATVPFQSLECYLSNIRPPPGQTMFSEEARQYFEELVSESSLDGSVLEACVVAYEASDGVPYIQLFRCSGEIMEDLAETMVKEGYAVTLASHSDPFPLPTDVTF